MQLLLLGLFVALYLHDATTTVTVHAPDGGVRGVEALPADQWPHLDPMTVALLVLLPKLLIAGLYHVSCKRARRALGTPHGQRALDRLETFSAALPLILLGLFALDLVSGALRSVRIVLQHVVLIDEAIVLAPTLLLAALAWWSYYPVDRRLREAMIFRLADSGKPVYPLLSRGQYVSMQARHQFGLLLLPLLTIYAWVEAVSLFGSNHAGPLPDDAATALTTIGIFTVFLLAPLVIRYVWHTSPLPAGELRERMVALCEQHRVRVRELLLWRTGGGLVNAAVTGLISRVRYILLSDGLLDQVTPREVEAVMAHEIAHVKLRHIIWMGLALIVSLGVFELATHTAIDFIVLPMLDTASSAAAGQAPLLDLQNPSTRMLATAVPVFGLTMLVFGWVSRRIERQADVFAARYLCRSTQTPQHDELAQQVFDTESVETMVSALQRVSDLNHVPTERKSWRHGSIAWRQSHLRSLVGQPLDATPVDVTLTRIKIATLLGLAVMISAYALGQ